LSRPSVFSVILCNVMRLDATSMVVCLASLSL
jgi:hypothetical protein